MNYYTKNESTGDTETSNNTLHITKHTSSSILSYRVGLDPIATFCLEGWIERTQNIPGYILNRLRDTETNKHLG